MIVVTLPRGDVTPLVVRALSGLLDKRIPDMPVVRELSDPVGLGPVVGTSPLLVEFKSLVDNGEVGVEDPAELEGAEAESVGWDGSGARAARLDCCEFEGLRFGIAVPESPLECEGPTVVKFEDVEPWEPDGTVLVPSEVVKRLLESPVPTDETLDVKAIPLDPGVTLTLSCLK